MSLLSTRRRIGAAAGALAAAALAVPTATVATASPLVVLSAGHVDAVDVAYEDGAFALSVHDETVEPDVERDPAGVLFVAKPESAVAIPDDPAYRFLGRPGRTVWVLPEVQDENLLWAGLSAEEIEPGVFVDDTVRVVLTRVQGPNGVSLFDTAQDGGPNLLADSEDGLPDVIELTAGDHRHANWAFEAPGTYRITYRVVGRLAANNCLEISAPATLRFVVQR